MLSVPLFLMEPSRMSWKEPADRHNDAIVEAIHAAAHIIAKEIHRMADLEAQALADLNTAITNIGAAITVEIEALKAALANNVPPVDNSPAIEAAVSNLNALAKSLTDSVTPPVTPTP